VSFTIEVFIRQAADRALHLDISGLQPGQLCNINIATPNRLGRASFIGTIAGTKPVEDLVVNPRYRCANCNALVEHADVIDDHGTLEHEVNGEPCGPLSLVE